MRFKITLPVLLFFISSYCTAQTLVSAFYPLTSSPYLVNKIVKVSAGNIYYETYDINFNVNLEKQESGDLKTTHIAELYDTKENSGDLAQICYTDTGIFVLEKSYNASKKTISISVSEYDYTGRFLVPAKNILNIENAVPLEKSEITVRSSSSNKAFLIEYSGAKDEDVRLFSFDDNWKKMASKNTAINKTQKGDYYSIDGIGVRDDGSFYYGMEYDIVQGKIEKSSYTLYSVTSAGVDSTAFAPAGEALLSFSIVPDGNTLQIFGLTETSGASTGVYRGTYFIKEKAMKENSVPFDQKMFITPGEHAETGMATTTFGPDARISGVYKMDNDNYDIMVESTTWKEKPGVGGGTDLFVNAPNFYVVNMSSGGAVNWISTVFRQHTYTAHNNSLSALEWSSMSFDYYAISQKGLNFFSNKSAAIGNSLYILANDAPINSFQPTNQDNVVPVTNASQLQGVLITIGEKGEITKDVLTNSYQDKIMIYPCLSFVDKYAIASAYFTLQPDECGVALFSR